MEHSNLLAWSYSCTFLDSDLASGNLGHPNSNEAHQPDLVIGFDENKNVNGKLSDVRLGLVGSSWMLGLAAARNENNPFDCAFHGRVPAVITARADESLEDSAAFEGFGVIRITGTYDRESRVAL
jgi:hypothetical protein